MDRVEFVSPLGCWLFMGNRYGEKIGGARESQEAELLLTAYEEKFKKRYKTEVLLNDRAGIQRNLIFLVQKYSIQKLLSLVSHYFDMNGDKDWFLIQSHNLKTFEANLNQISISLAKKQSSYDRSRLMESCLYCDCCWSPFSARYSLDVNFSEVMISCPKCRIKEVPFKYPTKEEFHKNWQNFPSFKKPTYEKIFKEKKPFPMPYLEYEIPTNTGLTEEGPCATKPLSYEEEERLSIIEEISNEKK